MAELPSVFAADDHEPMQEFGLMPQIWYLGHIKKSEIKSNSAKTGKRLNMQVLIEGSQETNFEEEDCKQKGRLVFIGLNLSNPSSQCVEISQRELRSICDATKIKELEDTEELHDISFGFKLGVESSEGYADKNIIKKYVTEEELMAFEFDSSGNVIEA